MMSFRQQFFLIIGLMVSKFGTVIPDSISCTIITFLIQKILSNITGCPCPLLWKSMTFRNWMLMMTCAISCRNRWPSFPSVSFCRSTVVRPGSFSTATAPLPSLCSEKVIRILYSTWLITQTAAIEVARPNNEQGIQSMFPRLINYTS